MEFAPLWVALTHSHLSRLADAGVIEYAIDRGMILLTQKRDTLEWLLECIDEWRER